MQAGAQCRWQSQAMRKEQQQAWQLQAGIPVLRTARGRQAGRQVEVLRFLQVAVHRNRWQVVRVCLQAC